MKKLFIPLSIVFFFLTHSPALSYADSMHCDYTVPLDFQGTPPATNIDAFNYSKSDCTINVTPTTNYIASPSAYVDIASTSAVAVGLHEFFYMIWVVCVLGVLFIGFSIGVYIYRR